MLIFEENSQIVAKVADFGYATCFQDDSDWVSVPKSEPWCAPEHKERKYRPLEAKQMDVYSFGLLCAWLLFKAGSSIDLSLPSNMIHKTDQYVSFERDEPEKNMLQLWRKDHKLLDWVCWLVCENSDLDSSIKDHLISFFRFTLTFKPRSRCVEFDQLLGLLVPERYMFEHVCINKSQVNRLAGPCQKHHQSK